LVTDVTRSSTVIGSFGTYPHLVVALACLLLPEQRHVACAVVRGLAFRLFVAPNARMMMVTTTTTAAAVDPLSLDGLDLSEIATVGPCQHVLRLKVALEAATNATTGGAAPTIGSRSGNDATKRSSNRTNPNQRAAPMIGCPKCAAAAARTIDRGGQQTAAGSRPTTATIQSVTDGLASKGRPHVAFKYKNCLYSLGLVVVVRDAATTTQTAQGRIAHVVGLTSMKILCRGKVVYPSKTMSEEQVSQFLLQISSSDHSSTASSNPDSHHPTHKVSLLVMGTVSGHELVSAASPVPSHRNASDTDQQGFDVKSSVAWWWNVAVSWTGYAAHQSVRFAHAVLVTALWMIQAGCSAARDLFYLTAASTPSNNNNNNNSTTTNPPRPPAATGTAGPPPAQSTTRATRR
jgi:hypothetical protein